MSNRKISLSIEGGNVEETIVNVETKTRLTFGTVVVMYRIKGGPWHTAYEISSQGVGKMYNGHNLQKSGLLYGL